MRPHEFESGEPAPATTRMSLRTGDCTPEAGEYACLDCDVAAIATLIVLEKDRELPICHTCNRPTNWRKVR